MNKRILSIVAIGALSLAASGCVSGGTPSTTVPSATPKMATLTPAPRRLPAYPPDKPDDLGERPSSRYRGLA